MRLKDSYITYENGSDHILMDSASGFSGLVHGNRTAAFIVECLKEETTEAEITEKMLVKYEVDEETAAKGIHGVITKLKEIGAIIG